MTDDTEASGAVSPTYDFETETQNEILNLLMTDEEFCRKTDGLIKPSYFQNEHSQYIAKIALAYYGKYKSTPPENIWGEIFKKQIANKVISVDKMKEVVPHFNDVKALSPKSKRWLMDNIAEFAQQQAFTAAIIESAGHINNVKNADRFTNIVTAVKAAEKVGLSSEKKSYNYFDRTEERKQNLLDIASGKAPKIGITTGIKELDEILDHGGYGRKELTLWMGGPKSGKSFALVQAGGSAILNGRRVLHVSLENSTEVTAKRYDAFFSRVGLKQQRDNPHTMSHEIDMVRDRYGSNLYIEEFPAGSFKPNDLQRLLEKYADDDIHFDLIVVDYLDIMAPNHRTDNVQENSKDVYVNARACAQQWNAALVSATQTNRTGAQAVVAKATDVAEDFNRVRIADLTISINRTDDEKASGKLRLYLAAGRNQEDGLTLHCKSDFNLGRSVMEVESVE